MKRTFLLPFLLAIVLTLPPLTAEAQVGPGGVGSIVNTQLWLRSDSLIVIQPLYFVTSWYDLSGHMRDFGPVVMGQTVPSLTLDAVNGYPAVTFTDQGGVGGDFLGYNGSLGIAGSDAATVVIVARNSTAADEQNGGLYMGQKNLGGANAVRSYNLEYADAIRFNGHDQVFSDGHTAGDLKIIYYTNPSGASVSGYGAYLNGTPLTGSSSSGFVPSLVSNFALLGATQMNATFNPAGYFNGEMMEVVLFSGQLNDAERVVLHNNLGAKYLLPIADDHYAWEVTHSHDVTGLAAYNGTTFTNAWSTGMLSVTSPADLTDGEYLFFGHDKGGAKTWTTDEVPAPGTYRLAREWRFDETSDVGTVTISLPASSLPALPAGYPMVGILTDDDGDFTSGAVMHRPTLTAGVYTLDLNITDGQHMAIIAFRPEVNFTVASDSGTEDITSVTVQAYLNYPHTADLTADYAATGGTATLGVDYNLAPGTITIASGSVSGSFTINVINDALVEPSETIVTTLSNPSAELSVGSQSSHTYTILNDDYVYASFSSATASGAEGNASAPVTSLEIVVSGGVISQPGSLIVMVSNGTASSADWSQTGNMVSIPAGDYTTPVSIPIPASVLTIMGDLTVEPDETVNLSMNTFVTVTAGTVVNSVYTIINDDNSTVSVAAETPTVDEGGPGAAGTGTFAFTLSNPVSTSRTVSYTVSGTAAPGADFVVLSGSVVIPAGALTYNLTLTTVADLIVEGDETVVITITGVSGAPAVSVNSTPAVITIADDDVPVILYSPAAVNMAEGSTTTVEVWLESAPAAPVTIDVTTLMPGLLNISPATLTFNSSNYATHQVITLQSVENTSLGDQTDHLILSVNDALSHDTFDPLPDIDIPITIVNNDVASIVVNPVSVTVDENGTATFTVSLSAAPVSGSVTVDLISNNTDVATINITQLTFTTVNYNVPQTITVTGVNNNTVPDASTTISLAVNDALSDDGYDGVTAVVSVNVTNDDLAGFVVNPLSLTINEGGPAGQFTIVLTAQPVADVVFDLVNAAPVHTTHLPQVTFTSANWNIPLVVTVAAVEDVLDADRTDIIAVTVNQALSDNSFDGLAAQNVTVNIEDDDPPVITGCPADITVSNDPGTCSAVVSWTAPVSTAAMVSTHLPGSALPVGVTTVTYTSTDDDGLVSICSFDVTVNDTEPPVVVCADASVTLDATGNASIVAADVLAGAPTDNCAVASVTLSQSSFTCADLGSVTVTVTVTDASGNTATCDATVTVSDPSPAPFDAGPDAALCSSETGYQVTGAFHTGGSVSWYSSGDGTFDDLTADNPYYTFGPADYTAGTVTLTMEVTGAGSCGTVTDEAVITLHPLPVVQVMQHDDISCTGLSDGEIVLSATGSADPYAFSIDGAPFHASGSFTGLTAATYYFEVMDANGCITDTSLTVIEPLPFTATLDSSGNVTCHGAGDGAVYTTLTGGTAPYSIIWTGPDGFTASSADIEGLAGGIYEVTVTDLNGCATFNFTREITEPDAMAITGVTLSDFGGFGVSCPESYDGSVAVTVAGGTPPLVLSWSGPGGFTSDADAISFLPAGTYTLTITDGNGCVMTSEYTLSAPAAMNITAETVPASCPDTRDGTIDLTVTGGAGELIFLWSDGITSADRSGLLSGDYTVAVTDANGCLQQQTVTVGVAGVDCLTVYEIITPNGDGSNDTWRIRNAGLYPDAEVFVYTRWGKLVYNSRNLADEWDGRYNGKLLPNDSYHYVIHLNDGSEPRTGVITIISK
jgi:gliding motility-associated-like protein